MRRWPALLSIAACHHTTPLAKEQLASAFVDSLCTYKVACGEFPDSASCHRAYLGVAFFVESTRFAAIDAGKIVYDGIAARDCMDAIATTLCDRTSQSARVTAEACDHIVAGTLHVGAPCTLDEECISLTCSIPIMTMQCSVGQCMGDTAPSRQLIGGSCANKNACAAGGYCDINSTTCVALVARGGTCTQDFQCAYGNGCVNGACAPLPVIGQACTTECRDDATACSTGKQCVKLGLPGAPCATRADCSPYYTCDAGGHCAEGSSQGGPCMMNNDCFDASYCGPAMTCAPPQADGATCVDDRDCTSSHCDCTATPATCTSLPMCV